MRIFYIEVDEFLKTHNKEFLMPYADIKTKTEKRFYEYAIGRYLVKQVAKKYYNINNTEIVVSKNGKPFFKNEDLYFSVSHSKNIVIASFDEYPCGIDVEYMKERNLKKLSKYFDKGFYTQEDFYKFWTVKEATYKSGKEYADVYSFTPDTNYFASVVSMCNIVKECLSISKYVN